MENTKIEIIKKIRTAPEVFTMLSRATKLPFVICDPESFNDQVWIFETKEGLEEKAKLYAEKKNPLAAIKVENKSYLNFYTVLYTLGVNAVVFFDKDGQGTEFELEEIVKKPDFSRIPEAERPLLNPQLQLCGIYFMQEFRRGVKMEEKENIVELEEELAANLVKSRYILAVHKPKDGEGENKNVQVPYIKNKDGDVFQPVFTDPEEFKKFKRNQDLNALLVTFENLEKVLIPTAKGIVVNPQGFNLIVSRENLKNLKLRFRSAKG